MSRLTKHRHSTGDNDKYYIKCPHWTEDASSIRINELVKSNEHMTILRAVATDDTIRKKNRHIVVKISRETHGVAEEYKMGVNLNGLPGFIKFICIFPCYDSTHVKMAEDASPIPTHNPICQADHTQINRKDVLVMPYIHEGSLAKYNWTERNVDLLRNLIIHTIFSIVNAFIHKGFIHRDLHWGNVLFKRTTQEVITYDIKPQSVTIPTNGYKVVIMDFEKSAIGYEDTEYLWEDIRFLLKTAITTNKQKERIDWDIDTIMQLLQIMRKQHTSVEYANDIIKKIYNTPFTFSPIILAKVYDPNTY
jgi:serine/threonine protein kinase